MIIVTSGASFLDIDAYAGIIAYTDLLNLMGTPSKAISTAPLNESITPEIRSWGTNIESAYLSNTKDSFCLIDVSEPEQFDSFVDTSKVSKIIDHHPGYQNVWEKLGTDAVIEPIGAACTLVFEAWMHAELIDKISVTNARLLIAGILDNTLNFRAGVTTERDRQAYEELMNHAELPDNWPAKYFRDCQVNIEADLAKALKNDTKTIRETDRLPLIFGQLVVWDGQKLVRDNRAEIAATLGALGEDWALNLVSIGEGKSYFLADNPTSQAKLGKTMGVNLSSGTAEADRLWLRKEILKRAQE